MVKRWCVNDWINILMSSAIKLIYQSTNAWIFKMIIYVHVNYFWKHVQGLTQLYISVRLYES